MKRIENEGNCLNKCEDEKFVDVAFFEHITLIGRYTFIYNAYGRHGRFIIEPSPLWNSDDYGDEDAAPQGQGFPADFPPQQESPIQL